MTTKSPIILLSLCLCLLLSLDLSQIEILHSLYLSISPYISIYLPVPLSHTLSLSDEALAQELAKKVEGLMKLKDEIDSKINTLPTKSDIENIQENYVSWIGLDEILRNYKPPRTPVPPSREGIAALQKADELDQKTDDLGSKLTGLQQEVC